MVNLIKFANATTAYANEVNDVFNGVLALSNAARADQVRIMQNAAMNDQGDLPINTTRDVCTDSTGWKNLINSGNSTMIYESAQKAYVTTPFVIIKATGLTIADFAINNCTAVLIRTGEWKLSCSTGLYEVRRAQIYKTLFYGTVGTDARVTSTYITGLTALETNMEEDIGRRAHYATHTWGGVYSSTAHYTGTFGASSSTSSWSYCYVNQFLTSQWEIPNGTARNTQSGTGTSDETGTDTTGDDGAASTCDLYINASSSGSNSYAVRAIILCDTSISWVKTGTLPSSYSNIDFQTDHSIPNLAVSSEPSAEYTETVNLAGTGSDIVSLFAQIDGALSSYSRVDVSVDGLNWETGYFEKVNKLLYSGNDLYLKMYTAKLYGFAVQWGR